MCFSATGDVICRSCRSELRTAPERILPGGIRAIAAYRHTGPAAQLMHGAKYRGLDLLLWQAAGSLGRRIDSGRTFVPVPRVFSRFVKYAIDPAQALAERLARVTSGRVENLLKRPLHASRRAGSKLRGPATVFEAIASNGAPVVIVDDVLTTGATVLSAAHAILPRETFLVVTATSAKTGV